MNLSLVSTFLGFAGRGLAGAALVTAVGWSGQAQSPKVLTSHDTYLIDEPISVQFLNGPGNPKDWVGIYPFDATPGGPPSTVWQYTDAAGGVTGLKEGVLTFSAGLSFAGDWKTVFLENDGYTILSELPFRVVDPGTPLARVNKRIYTPGEDIVVTFSSGPANAKDWIGVYPAGETPDGDPTSIIWNYVDGTQTGATGVPEGTITFTGGLPAPGEYVVWFLVNDGYETIASESFSVVAPIEKPRLLTVSPANGATGTAPLASFSASITNGASKVVVSSVVLKIDGQTVNATAQSVDGLTTVTYTGTDLQAPLSTHTYQLTFQDDASPANTVEVTGSYTVAQYENILLPAPIVVETFDSTAEGQVPTGWTLKSYTEVLTPDLDLGNLDSASFANWVVLDVSRFTGSFVTYSDPENPDSWETDYQRVLAPNPLNVVNGQVVTNLATGRMLFANSGYRNGASQVLFAFSPDYDLTGKTDVHLVFNSLYEQNQDSMGALEYSIDGGANWLPIVYLLDRNDILQTDGVVDAELTFNEPSSGVAVFTNDNGETVGGNYGAFIAAPISPALAPYLSGRVDDNRSESKRVEKFRLTQADNQKTVRLRFAYAGTDSWYWGVDNVGFYSIATTVTPPSLSYSVGANGLTLSWPAGTGSVLESASGVGQTTWNPVPGVTGNSVTVPFSAGAEYFRLRQP